jgi:hypothetical protein
MMMEYIPGQIHENFQKEHFFLVNNDFNWINCKDKRWGEMSDSKDWDEANLSLFMDITKSFERETKLESLGI